MSTSNGWQPIIPESIETADAVLNEAEGWTRTNADEPFPDTDSHEMHTDSFYRLVFPLPDLPPARHNPARQAPLIKLQPVGWWARWAEEMW